MAQPPGKKRKWGPPPASVMLTPVIEKNIRNQITSIGTIEAQLATTVSSEIQGLTKDFKLQEGSRIKKGETILVRLKSSGRKIDLAEAQAAHRRALSHLEKARRGKRPEEIEEVRAQLKERKALMQKYERDLERASELLRNKIINLSEYNRTESDFLAAKYQVQRLEQSLQLAEMGERREDIEAQEAEVQKHKANLDRMRDELAKTIIRAPISGFITKKHVEVGQWIQRGGKVADIINIDTVLVRTGIQEKDISNIKVGDLATITVDAYQGQTFKGKVRDIIPQADIASRSFPVKIEVENPRFQLKAGMFARVTLFYGTKKPAIMVPKDALNQLGLRAHVFVVHQGNARLVPVKTGRTVKSYIEIIEGRLAKGARVIVRGNETLRDRSKVIVRAIRTVDGKMIAVKAQGSRGGWSEKNKRSKGKWGSKKTGQIPANKNSAPGSPSWDKRRNKGSETVLAPGKKSSREKNGKWAQSEKRESGNKKSPWKNSNSTQ